MRSHPAVAGLFTLMCVALFGLSCWRHDVEGIVLAVVAGVCFALIVVLTVGRQPVALGDTRQEPGADG